MLRLDTREGGQEEEQGDQIHVFSDGGCEVSRHKRRGFRGQGYMEG